MKAKKSMMKSLAMPSMAEMPMDKKFYPSTTFDSKDLNIGDAKVGDKVTVHIHGKIKGINQRDNGEHRVDVEMQKGVAKKGHIPFNGKDEKEPKEKMFVSKNKPQGSSAKNIISRIKAGK